MGDVSDKGSECEDMMMMSPEGCGSVSSDGGDGLIKTCADCGTSKTPLWRGGPAGPKSLCNACGIRSRKRRALLGLSAKDDKKPKKTTTTFTTTTKDDTKPKKTTIRITTSTKDDTKPKKTSTTISTTTTSDGDSQKSGLTTIYRSDYMGDLCLKKRIMALGSEVIVQRPRSKVTKHRRRRSEEEKAAYLLMAISCGSVFA